MSNFDIAQRILNDMGLEPVFSKPITEEDKNAVLGKALSWYSQFKDTEDLAKELLIYLEKNSYPNFLVEIAKKVNTQKIGITMLALCRLVNINGKILPPSSSTKLTLAIEKFLESHNPARGGNRIKPPKNVQDYISLKTSKIIGELDEVIDQFVDGARGFSLYTWLKREEPGSQIVNKIKEHFGPLHSEVKAAIEGDKYLQEAYRSCSENENLQPYEKFLDSFIKDCDIYLNNAKKTRAPRKVKFRPVEKTVKSVKYLRSFDPLKLVSVTPDKIVGATTVWLYIPKYRYLTWLVSDSKLTVKGTTIQDFNPTKSIRKMLRKPNEVIPKVLEGGKVSLRQLMSKVRSKPGFLSGRLNEETIILRVTD